MSTLLALVVGLAGAAPALAHYLKVARELVAPGAFTLGVSLTGPPFAYKQDGRLRGFEMAMAEAVATAHGLELRAVQLARDRLRPALAAGEVDAVNTLALEASGEDVGVVPYLRVGDHVMVLRGNPFRVHGVADLSGRTVAVTAGSTAEAFARAVNGRLREAGREPMNVHAFPGQRFTHFPVSMGHAAAYFVRTVSAVGITRDPHSRTRLLEGAFRPVEEAGFGVAAGRERVYHAIEHAVAGMVATGEYRRLREAYGLPPELSPYRDALAERGWEAWDKPALEQGSGEER